MQTEKMTTTLILDITVDYTYDPYDNFVELVAVKLDQYPEVGNVLNIITDEDHDIIIQRLNELGKDSGQP